MKDQPVPPESLRFAEDLTLLRNAQGDKLTTEDLMLIGEMIDRPAETWDRARGLVIAPGGTTIEQALTAVGVSGPPSLAQLREAIAFASR